MRVVRRRRRDRIGSAGGRPASAARRPAAARSGAAVGDAAVGAVPGGNAPKHMKATSVGRLRSLTGSRFGAGPQAAATVDDRDQAEALHRGVTDGKSEPLNDVVLRRAPRRQIDDRDVVLGEVEHVGERPRGVEHHPGRAAADREGGEQRRAGRIEDVDLAGVEAVDEEAAGRRRAVVLVEEGRARAGLEHVGRRGGRGARVVVGDVEADQVGRHPLERVGPLGVVGPGFPAAAR